jgi:uncharacterized Zn-finger protein
MLRATVSSIGTGTIMAVQTKVPHLVNDKGVDKIKIGVKEFQCMGASPPFDHPHVFLNMGDESQIICPYCSTLFVYDGRLDEDESDPPSSIYVETSPPGAPAA